MTFTIQSYYFYFMYKKTILEILNMNNKVFIHSLTLLKIQEKTTNYLDITIRATTN
jgi:hypothetical protein